jgi:hypothetical protein
MANTAADQTIKEQLTQLLTGAHAHVTFEDTVAGIAFENIGKKPGNLPYSIWQLVEHIRITQWDILEFSRNRDHQSPEWPKAYWPDADAPADENEWQNCLCGIRSDRDEFVELLNKPESDLYTPFSYGTGQTLLREAMLIADHTSYHTGQILEVRRLLNDWD